MKSTKLDKSHDYEKRNLTQSTHHEFKEHNHFGMDPKDVVLFEQRMIPCLDNDGKVIRESADKGTF